MVVLLSVESLAAPEAEASVRRTVVVVVVDEVSPRRVVVGVVAADVGRLALRGVVRVVVVFSVVEEGVVEGREVRVVGVGRVALPVPGVGRVAELLGVVRVAEGVAVRDERGVRVVVRVADVDVAEVEREDGVVRDAGVLVVGVALVVVLVVAVVAELRTAPPGAVREAGVARAVGRGVPGLTLVVAGEALVEATAEAAGRDRAAAAVVVRGVGRTGAFLAGGAFSLPPDGAAFSWLADGGAISDKISESWTGISALGVWMGEIGRLPIMGSLMGVEGITSLIGVWSSWMGEGTGEYCSGICC